MAQSPVLHSSSPMSSLLLLSAPNLPQVGHVAGASSTRTFPSSISDRARMSARTELGQLYSGIGSDDRSSSTAMSSSVGPTSARCSFLTTRTLLDRTAWRHEKPAALSQKTQCVDISTQRTQATTLHNPVPVTTTKTAVCPVRKTSIGPSASQSSGSPVSACVARASEE
ncbi:hypothetical protein I4F81_012798 [Pyropia yezoensis]|uniref:Uncharacterized protein n=1 Tax=Pyropia yezoensis TaxID=2788 RepID=A0ACC3CK53_PYRYE|nr:hypothetical protein I4F81_012798 [Neopyropia yezoensis]